MFSAVITEYERQKEHLENSVAKLKSELSHQNHARKTDALRLMQENVGLIKEITKMRREIKLHNQLQRQRDIHQLPAIAATTAPPVRDEEKVSHDDVELRKVADLQRQQIEQLRATLEVAQQRRISTTRPISRDRYTMQRRD